MADRGNRDQIVAALGRHAARRRRCGTRPALVALPWKPRIVLTSSDAEAAGRAEIGRSGVVAFMPKDELPSAVLDRVLGSGLAGPSRAGSGTSSLATITVTDPRGLCTVRSPPTTEARSLQPERSEAAEPQRGTVAPCRNRCVW
jgi:hypothetical protein